ncbi:MAG TPA: DUF503 domain-containing protein [Gemmatimonadota bacterium]|nr:DUF503 domain-containing protein [Gemmatimonadota bacterium]
MAFVGYSVFDIHIQNVHSLKEKRFVLRSVKDRIAQKFNVAVSETGYQDKWQRCELAVAAVAGERRSVERTLEGVRAMLDGEPELRVISDESDIL